MLTPYDKRQQAREGAAFKARLELRALEQTPAEQVHFVTDWDAALAALAPLDPPQGGAAC